MRSIAKRTLRASRKQHPRAKGPLKAWHQEVDRADWATPSEVKTQFQSASVRQNNRVAFNIAGNHYRLVVKINYPYRIVYVRFIGTHADYDTVDVTAI